FSRDWSSDVCSSDLSNAPVMGEEELQNVSSLLRQHLDSKYRPVPVVGVYGRRLDRLSRSYRNLNARTFDFKVYGGSRIDVFALRSEERRAGKAWSAA